MKPELRDYFVRESKELLASTRGSYIAGEIDNAQHFIARAPQIIGTYWYMRDVVSLDELHEILEEHYYFNLRESGILGELEEDKFEWWQKE